MALLVDDAEWQWRGRVWCHLISDTSVEELQAFARRLGIPDRAFQGDHYDLTDELRDCAIAEGARPVPSREIVLALRAAGLRRRSQR